MSLSYLLMAYSDGGAKPPSFADLMIKTALDTWYPPDAPKQPLAYYEEMLEQLDHELRDVDAWTQEQAKEAAAAAYRAACENYDREANLRARTLERFTLSLQEAQAWRPPRDDADAIEIRNKLITRLQAEIEQNQPLPLPKRVYGPAYKRQQQDRIESDILRANAELDKARKDAAARLGALKKLEKVRRMVTGRTSRTTPTKP